MPKISGRTLGQGLTIAALCAVATPLNAQAMGVIISTHESRAECEQAAGEYRAVLRSENRNYEIYCQPGIRMEGSDPVYVLILSER